VRFVSWVECEGGCEESRSSPGRQAAICKDRTGRSRTKSCCVGIGILYLAGVESEIAGTSRDGGGGGGKPWSKRR